MRTTLRKFKRVRHYDTHGDAHFLTFSCYKHQRFLVRDLTCEYLADAIERAQIKQSFHLWAYVFMPEHVHLLIWPRENCSVSLILLSIKQSVARKAVFYLRSHNPDGLKYLATGQKHAPYPFWQDGSGYDANLHEPRALLSRVEYIHANPVRSQLVEYPEDWKWSSVRDWAGSGTGPLRLDLESFPY